MLQTLRDNLKGAVAVVVVGLMVVPLVLFGVDSIFVNSENEREIASVNGEEITETELQRAIMFRQSQMRSQFGEDLPEQLVSEENLREPVLESLITRKILHGVAEDGGMTIPEEQIDQVIVGAPEFQTDGQFSADLFRQRVMNVGFTPTGYRQQLAQDMVLDQHVTALTASGFATEAELERFVALSQQQRDFYYLTVPVSDVQEDVSVSEEDLRAYYEEHREEYRNPEQVSVEYLEVNMDEILAEIDIPEEVLREQYQEEVAAFDGEAERRAAHILLEPADDGGAPPELEEVQERLDAGEDFADVAREYSEDTGSRGSGGDLGFTTGDTFPEAFESTLAELEEGEVSEPVETDAGFHMIKLTELRGNEPPSFEEDRERIAQALRESEAEQLFLELREEMAEVTFTSDDLAEAGELIGLERQVEGPFSRDGGLGIASNEPVVEAAFSPDVLEEGHTSEVLELSPEHAVVLRVTDHQQARTLAFEEVRNDIERTLKRETAAEQVAEVGESLEREVAQGRSVEEVAQANDYEWQVSLDTEREGNQVEREILEYAFGLPRPQDGDPVVSGFNASGGDYVVVQLTDVTDGDYQSLSDSEKTSVRERVAGMTGDSAFAAYQAALRDQARVETD